MPYLSSRLPDLRRQGPVIEVFIVPPAPIVNALISKGIQYPAFKAIALIDTGATSTCITPQIVETLNLRPFDTIEVGTPNGKTIQLGYDIGVILPIAKNMPISVQSPCANLDGQPYQVLIGRDILSICTMFYNGHDGSFTLHI